MEKRKMELACKRMRKNCLIMADAAGKSGLHFGGTLSLIEILAALYLDVMDEGKIDFKDEYRDRVILSKGHGVPALYAVLCELGYLTEEDLNSFKRDETELYGHPCMNEKLGIEFSSGSLGQGVSLGVGTALALKMHENQKSRVFVILGDGECDEGSVWEAAMSAAKYNLDNLCVIVDKNQIQYDGTTEEIMPLCSLEDKWKSFGFDVETIDGHDVDACVRAFKKRTDCPRAIIAETIKGKGISFMEGVPAWHHAMMTKSQREQAWEEIAND